MSNMRRAFQTLCKRAGLGDGWITYELRHSFVSLVSDQLDDLIKVADLAGHVDTRTTEGYRHAVRQSLPHAITAWDSLLGSADGNPCQQLDRGSHDHLTGSIADLAELFGPGVSQAARDTERVERDRR